MNELESARKEINQIDEEMAKLFERRMHASEKVAAYKKERGLSVRDRARETTLIDQNRKYIENAEIEAYYVPFIRNVIDQSCSYQTRLMGNMKVAYCGVVGAFAEIAAKRLFPEAELVPCRSFADAYHAVEAAEADCAVLPLENSYAGEVGGVMDLLFSGELYINQVLDLAVRHCLMVNHGASMQTVKTVVSHPQALQQCADFLSHYDVETKEYSNTAAAAEYVHKSGDLSVAAIASEKTAKLYDLEILQSHINDAKNNVTRFGVFSRISNRENVAAIRGNENFILVFTVQNKAGALAQTLNIIGAHGYNMRNLRSRPMKDLQWSYYFYIEAEGNIHNENGRDMLRELSAICARLKLVGTFCTDGSSREATR